MECVGHLSIGDGIAIAGCAFAFAWFLIKGMP